MKKIKNLKQKLVCAATVGVLSLMAAVPCLASTPPDPYAATTAKIIEEAEKMIASGSSLVVGTIGSGIVIFAAFKLFSLGKRSINAAVSSK